LAHAEGSPVIAWEPVIGLEVHAQLLTSSKLFCGCSTRFGDVPNDDTCPVCLGLPGALPVLNRRAVELGVRAALGLGCTVHLASEWSRKNYFYPDLPKGYQISQYDRPFATSGILRFQVDGEERALRIRRIHLEEDAGKNVHDVAHAGQRSFVDFNRGGTPLVEIVSEPDLHSAAEAAAAMRALRQILRYLEVCDGNLEEGSLRCDANVSVRPVGVERLGTRTELKNINSFRFVQQAVDFEIRRQEAVLEAGGNIEQETRLWDAGSKTTKSMRGKEEAHDYRYFPDPDLPTLRLPQTLVDGARGSLPELPAAKVVRYVGVLGLTEADARVLTEDADVARFFESALTACNRPRTVANWVVNEVLHVVKGTEGTPGEVTHERLTEEAALQLAEIVMLVEEGVISGKVGKDLLAELEPGVSPRRLVAERGLAQVSDTSALEPVIEQVLAKHAESVAKYKAGKTAMLGFFVGQVMKLTGGKANPKLVSDLVLKKLS
jgi:aspartyl-tRNA(Asn)/glutamyl-tRNA(Gln) amidotransferase subunit B